MMGNVQFLITSICSVVIFAIILVAANTMAMSIRERTREICILKALVFQDGLILKLLLGESVLLSFSGAMIGTLAARAAYSNLNLAVITSGFVQNLNVGGAIIGMGVGIGVGVGILAAAVPAWSAAHRPAVEALRRVA
jgi:putative ABC transport system permease protein